MIYSWSKFNYGHTVDLTNKYISFDEGGAEIIAEIEVGDYTLTEYAQAVQDAFNVAGALEYVCDVDHIASKLTIWSGGGNFTLLIGSGTASATAYGMMGFNGGADLSGADSYEADDMSGTEYYPQFLLQSYIPPENFNEASESIINQSADGRTEVIRFGTRQKIEMDIKFITNLTMDGVIIRNNPTGLQDALDFLDYITQKKRFEFIPDVEATTYYKVILESMPGFGTGTGYKLKELFGMNLPDYYETGILTLRVVD